jgi:IclR family acetate operon transcriptional repressor
VTEPNDARADGEAPGDDGTVRAVLRALRILGQLGTDGLALTDLAGRVGLPVPTTLRLVRTLEAVDYVERRNNVIVLGTGVLRLAATMDPDGAFGWAVKAATERLRDHTQETACVYVRDGIESVAVSVAHAERDVRWVPTMGERFPIWFGGPADVLVAFGPTQRILADLRHDNERHGWTPDDPRWSDVDALAAIAEETRSRGYSINSRDRLRGQAWERASDVWGVSVPLFTPSKALFGALAFCAPSVRARQDDEAAYVSVATEIAAMTTDPTIRR